jgi:heptosyltransferase-1
VNTGALSEAPQSLLVVRLGAMGDVIHAMAAVGALRTAFPGTMIGWAIEERWAELLCARTTAPSGPRSPARPLVDHVHIVNTKTWRRSPLSAETRTQLKNAFSGIRGQRYEIAADFQGAIKSALLARLARARKFVGMAQPREAPARLLYKPIATSGVRVIEQYHSLAEAIVGRPLPVVSPEFPRDPQSEAVIDDKFAGKKLVILNPGAGWAAKQWPAERYGEVARALANRGLTPVINFGPGEEQLADAAAKTTEGAAEPVSCSISELIALTRRARLFIGGDTGPLHLAAAMKVPVVAIFGPTDPTRNGPYGTRSIVLRNPASRTSLSHTSDADPGLLKITPDEVIAAALRLLEDADA